MANISLTLYTNGFIGSVLMSPIQMGSLRVNNSVTNILRLGTFKVWHKTYWKFLKVVFSHLRKICAFEAMRSAEGPNAIAIRSMVHAQCDMHEETPCCNYGLKH